MWAVGIFEGEGSWSQTRYKGNGSGWLMRMKMTDEDVVMRFRDAVGVGKVKGPLRWASMKPHHKDLYEWSLCGGENLTKLVKEMFPYLGLRRRVRATQLLDWYGERERKVEEGEEGVGSCE